MIVNNSLVTVDEAAKEYHLRSGRIRMWLNRGYLEKKGYRALPKARPRTLIDRNELQEFLKIRGKLMP